MKVYSNFDQLTAIKNPVLTIGTFDGVHVGHQKIIQQLNTAAEKIKGESVLFTFYPHPRMVLFPDSHGLKLIQTQAEKLEKLRRYGLKNVIVYPFTLDFSRLTATEFVRDYLVNKLKVKKMIIGYDHQFGKNREGTLELLKDLSPIYDFQVQEIPAQDIESVNVSSTKIRNSLKNGDIQTATKYLGEYFELSGKVIHGNKIGRTINFPTANIEVDSEIKVIPANGVYAVRVLLENKTEHFGMLNIGKKPTVSNDNYVSIEVNILDFSADLYNQSITVKFLSKLRDEQKFEELSDLQTQIKKDEQAVRNSILTSNF
ncbi:MAG: bifunctional riboflavin kinase/FAD synthetase [Lishizhenia sp.]